MELKNKKKYDTMPRAWRVMLWYRTWLIVIFRIRNLRTDDRERGLNWTLLISSLRYCGSSRWKSCWPILEKCTLGIMVTLILLGFPILPYPFLSCPSPGHKSRIYGLYITNDWMQENHTTSNKTTWLVCCRISCRNSRTRRHLKCRQNKFDSKAGSTARVIETVMGQYFD